MDTIVELLQNPKILIYLLIVIGSQAIYVFGKYLRRRRISKRRKAQGLPDRILINHAEKLAERRIDALIQSGLLLAAIIITPFVLVLITESDADKKGLAIAFLVLLAWTIYSGTDILRAFLGGLAFKTIAAFPNLFKSAIALL